MRQAGTGSGRAVPVRRLIDRRRRLPGLLIGGIVLGATASCSPRPDASLLPAQLVEMPLQTAVYGLEADRIIGHLHRKDVAPTESAIGHYVSGRKRATLYVSQFGSSVEAVSQLGDMADRIGEASGGFGHHRRFSVAGRDVHVVLGQGQVHYFFTSGPHLMWLGASVEVARPALAELISVSLEEVPPLEAVLEGGSADSGSLP